MTYLLDTNAWAGYLNSRQSKIAARIESTNPQDILLCSVVKAELFYGAYKSSRRDANLDLLERLFLRFESLSFDDPAADEYGQLRAALDRKGTPIGPNDLLISAIALAHDMTLVTHNTTEFGRVPDLRIEDWEAPD